MPRKNTARKPSAQPADVQPIKAEVPSSTGSVEQIAPPNTADAKPAPGPVLTNPNPSAKPLTKAAAASTNATVRPSQDAIRQRAFEIYKERGTTGSAVEDWLRAERELTESVSQRKPA